MDDNITCGDAIDEMDTTHLYMIQVLLCTYCIFLTGCTGEDVPIFVAMFEKALKMDEVTGNIFLEDRKYDKSDRRKVTKILELLISWCIY